MSSSSSATPISLFENLAIDPDMSPTNTEIRSRAIEVRDILSSFNRDILPTEYKPQIFTELDRPFQHRPPVSQWTIQEDLEGTLLQWGAYNEEAYELLKQLQSQAILARCFYEKIARRLRDLTSEYDRLPDSFHTVRQDVSRIAEGFRNIVAAVKEDRPHSELGQEPIARILLDVLVQVCQRHMDLVTAAQSPTTPRRGTRRTASSSDGPANLFEALIKTPEQDPAEEPFIVGVLETFPRSIFASLHQDYTRLVPLLDLNHAPASFQYRVGRLLSGVDTRHLPSTSVESQSRGTSSQPTPTISSEPAVVSVTISQPQPQESARAETPSASGSRPKRSAEESTTITKRGKKKTTR